MILENPFMQFFSHKTSNRYQQIHCVFAAKPKGKGMIQNCTDGQYRLYPCVTRNTPNVKICTLITMIAINNTLSNY